ncbi:cytochrome d ubiquinol oxidase subunit II [Streptomyces caatingaensis]|uniref:cytochrome d ubiquinol oxidase subunit II n=1 Tax=Streptomyces caatingaensis TaxID=1678637 RepID=UPI000672782D|nr:cytochrome d ubiquinol oxidase subunit II [Streptomyces caatingaensis]
MDVFWYALVGLLLAGYLVLESVDFGVGMLIPFAGSEAARVRLRRTVVPLFLVNEVWLVAFGGLMFGALPLMEGELLHAQRLPVVVLLCAWFLRDAALWFRHATPGPAWRRTWDTVLPAASAVLAAGWGAVLATLVRGMSTGADGRADATAGDVFHPFSLLCAALVVVAAVRQGALFAGRGLPDGDAPGARLGRTAAVLTPVLAGLLLVTAGVGAAVTGSPAAVGAVTALAAVCVVASHLVRRAGRPVPALLLGTAPLLALPVMVALAHGTTVLATRSGEGDLPLSRAIADSSSLALLSVTALPALVAVALGQVWIWREFGRTAPRPA